jgi:hypothetical protein
MNLSDRALLVQLSISQWTARKHDKRVTQQATSMNYASDDAGRFNKALLPASDYLDVVHSKTAAIRQDFYTNTLPWGLEGAQLLPSANYLNFMTKFRSAKAEWERIVGDFVHHYPALKRLAMRSLGNMYREEDYPTEEQIRSKFKMDMAVFPVPSTDFRTQLASDELSRLQQDVVDRLREAEAGAARDVWNRLYERVEHISRQLSNPKGRIYDSLIEHARDLCTLLPRLNISDDPNLEVMRQEVESKLATHNPDALRANQTLRQDTADQAQQIMDKMRVFMEGL